MKYVRSAQEKNSHYTYEQGDEHCDMPSRLASASYQKPAGHGGDVGSHPRGREPDPQQRDEEHFDDEDERIHILDERQPRNAA